MHSSVCLLGEPLGEYHKIKTIKTPNIYISAYQATIRSYMKLRWPDKPKYICIECFYCYNFVIIP